MPHLDWTLNVPTLIALVSLAFTIGIRVVKFIARVEYKIDIMWIQFLVDHPEYERREALRGLR